MPTTVLIVEDEPNLLTALRYTLEQDGYETLTATDAVVPFCADSRISVGSHSPPHYVMPCIQIGKLRIIRPLFHSPYHVILESLFTVFAGFDE